MTTIRAATPADAAAVAAIWNPIISDTAITFQPCPHSEAGIAAIIAARLAMQTFLVALPPEGAVCGFATYKQFREGEGYARSMEHTVHLAPGVRGCGIGRTLLRAIEAHARDAGHRLMIGAITGTNLGSLRFHERLGYAEWGRIPAAGWKFGRFHDLVLMGRDLSSQEAGGARPCR